jgi:hypothetical protein
VAEPGVDVDMLGILGGSRQINAHIARHTAQAARGVADKHFYWGLRSHHDIPA